MRQILKNRVMNKKLDYKRKTRSFSVAKQWIRSSLHNPLVTYVGKSLVGDTREMTGREAQEWLDDTGFIKFHSITRLQYITEAEPYTREQLEKINKSINP